VTDSDGTNTVAFGYDGMSRALRKIGTQAVELTIDGQDPDEHIARIGGGTPTLFFHQDRSKSVYMVTDDSGAALEYYDYTAFGELRIFDPGGNERPSSAVGNRFGFQGHPFDVGLGLVDMRARFYRPSWGRFISPDPIGYAGGPSLYSFVGGAPLTYRDPTGLDAFRIGKYVQDQIEEFHIAMRVSRETGIPVRFGDTTYSVTDAIKDAIFDAPDNLRKFDAGLGRGLRKGAGSLWHSVTHPVETAKGMAKFILHLGSSGPTFGELLDGAWTWLNNTNPDDAAGQIGEVLGEIEFTLATAAVGGELWAYARRIWAARAATAEAAATGVAADSAAGAGQLRTVPPCQLGQVCGVGAGTGEGLGPRAAGAADAPRGVGKANAPKSTLPRDGCRSSRATET
jgi:RHS repeat-associated protein